jgi:putative ABC transport system permease protein
MQEFWRDIRFAWRNLRKQPGFALVAILTLALGIGANTALFSVVNGVLLRALLYPEPDRLVMLWEANSRVRNNHLSHLNFDDWRTQSRSFEYISAYTGRWGGPSTILGGREPVRAFVVYTHRDFFNVFGVAPQLGRTFAPEESNLGTEPVAVVSHGFWQRNLGAEADLSRKRLTIGDRSFAVIGVMPSGFSFPTDTDVWLSNEQLTREYGSRSSHNYIGVARLKPGVSAEQAQTELTDITRRAIAQDKEDQQHDTVAVVPMKEQMTGSIRTALLVLLAAVGAVLLIACANVANLLLARAVGRQKEVAIRTALGASRFRLVRQLLTESMLLALAGGALGLVIAFWLIQTLIALSPATIPRLHEIGLDARTLGFTLGTALLTSLLFGLAPAWQASKTDLNESLKEGGRTTSAGSGLLRNTLVVAEVALTLVLLIGAGLLLKSLWRVWQVNPGFNPTGVLTMQVSLPVANYPEPARRVAFYRQLFERVKALPGVESAGMVNNLPLGGVDINGAFGVAGRPIEQVGNVSYRVVSPDYHRALNIPLLKGRYFSEQDSESAEPVALISQRVAERYFANEDPLGQRVASSSDFTSRADAAQTANWPKIVGVVGNVKHFGLESRDAADFYVCYTQRPRRISDMSVVVRATGDPTNLSAALRQTVKSIDANLPINFTSMEDVFARSTANRRYSAGLLAAFAGLALLLAVIGIYGVLSYAVSQNTREIGVRVALGAQTRDILKLVIGQGLVLTLLGVALGIAAAFGLTRWLSTLLYGVAATDPLTFVGVPLLLLLVAAFACWLPARRAARVDPLIALRHE